MIGVVSQVTNHKSQVLERVSYFGLYAATEPFHTWEGSEEEATGERECLHTEAAGYSGVQTDAMLVFLNVIVHWIAEWVIVIVEFVFIRPKMETDTGCNVDERIQFATSVKIVAIVEEKRDFLEGACVQTIADTDADVVVLLDRDAVDEHTRQTDISPHKKSVFVNEIVGDLFLLLFLCVQSSQTAAQNNT